MYDNKFDISKVIAMLDIMIFRDLFLFYTEDHM